jgi:3-hydroxyacyl-CoA dehydrogenase
MKEEKQEALDDAMRAIQMQYGNSVQKGKLPADEAQSRLLRILPQLSYANFETADVIVEAAFENLEVKRTLFAESGQLAKPSAILATNTSYLNIDEVAEECSRPANVIGLHFFNPANAMRLVEVVPGRLQRRRLPLPLLRSRISWAKWR